MKISKDDSDRLAILRFPLIILVVFIHAFESSVSLSSGVVGVTNMGGAYDFIRILISQCIARSAVPLFFLISGYFFVSSEAWNYSLYLEKIRSRFKTLFLPFVFWNAATFFVFVCVQNLPALSSFNSGSKVDLLNLSFLGFFDVFFGLTRAPISYQFWFIRDLIFLVILSPVLIFTLAKKMWFVCFLIMIFLWVAEFDLIFLPSAEAFLFFYLGLVFRRFKFSLFRFDPYWIIVGFVYLLFAVSDAFYGGALSKTFLHKVTVLLGLVTFLLMTRFLNKRPAKDVLTFLSMASFFVFAAHEPLLTVLRKMTFSLVAPVSAGEVLVLYFACPIVVIVFLVATYFILSRFFPVQLALVSGGR